MSLKITIQLYKQADHLHQEIDDAYNKLDSGKVSDAEKETFINKTLNDVKRLRNVINKININDFKGHYDEDVIEDIEHNIEFFYEATDYIEKFLTQERYHDSLLNGVKKYVKDSNIYPGDYKRWATNEDDLAIKFSAMLLHPNNIDKFINQIKRMALGTMSKKEFKKIYITNKNKMIPLPKFESFEKYKEEKEKE